MKLFINDFDGARDDFVINTEENREYRIDAWIPAGSGKRVYLVSAYVYDRFIMFFYMYDLAYHPEYKKRFEFRVPENQEEHREHLFNLEKHFNIFSVNFEYEVNRLKSTGARGGACYPRQSSGNQPEVAAEYDEFTKMHLGEYDYLFNLMKESGRIPEELKNKELAFQKYCSSFEEPVSEIKNLAVYPQPHMSSNHYVGKTFTAPYGLCDLKVPYTLSDTGEESYIIIREVKFQNMLDSFEEQYDEFQKRREEALQDYEINKNKYRKNYKIMEIEEIRQVYDGTIMLLSLLKPEERRSFSFHVNEELNFKRTSSDGSVISTYVYFIGQDEDDKMEGEYYKYTASLGQVSGKPKEEYEITLMSVTDSQEIERQALLEREFYQ